jgi:uncharacterized membrane protein
MSFFFSGFVIIYYIISKHPRISLKTFVYAPINGILMSLGSLFLIIALSKGDVSIVTPIVQLSFIITVILACLFLEEKINPLQICGIACAAIAIIALGFA